MSFGKTKEKKTTSFDFIKSTAVEGCHYAWGALTSKLVLGYQAPVPCTYYVSAEYRLPVEYG